MGAQVTSTQVVIASLSPRTLFPVFWFGRSLMMSRMLSVLLVAAALTLHGCGGGGSKPSPAPLPRPSPSPSPAPSGDICSLREGVDCDHKVDLEDFGAVKTPAECCAQCKAKKGCKAWTWNKHTPYLTSHCFLKTDCVNQTKNENTTSGWA